MRRPRGALDVDDWQCLKYAYPDKMIYRVTTRRSSITGMFHGKPACTWYFSGIPPIYYFDNYWFAYAYAVKRGLRGEDLKLKVRR